LITTLSVLDLFAVRLTFILLVIVMLTNANSGDDMCIFHFAVARFDFSWMEAEYHQETLNNLRKAAQNVKKLCPVSSFFF
jgi:hypothetical protein